MRKPTPEERFWNQVSQIPDGCWIWIGRVDSGEYGQISVNARQVMAHRFSYELLVGPIPLGLSLDHLCRERLCVRPDHLEPVTHAENVRRGLVGQHWRDRTSCPKGHPYDAVNTRWRKKTIRKSGKVYTVRACRACDAIGRDEYNRAYYLRNHDRLIAYQRAYNARKRAERSQLEQT